MLVQVTEMPRMLRLAWNVTEENLRRNAKTIVFAPASSFFRAVIADQVTFVTKDPSGQPFPCAYTDILQASVVRCIANHTGIHVLQMALRPGIPRVLQGQALY